jgi:hypothetical protein
MRQFGYLPELDSNVYDRPLMYETYKVPAEYRFKYEFAAIYDVIPRAFRCM